MPPPGIVIWSATCALIVVLLGMIRYTVSKGIDNILKQLEKLWVKLEETQKENESLKAEVREIRALCYERHKE